MSQYLRHWGLDSSPYLRAGGPYPAPPHEEALARIDYLVAEGRSLGVLLGGRGEGKTTVLAAAARQLRRQGHQVAEIDAFGLSPRELVWQTGAQLGALMNRDDTLPQVWQRVADLGLEPLRGQTRRVVLVDNAGQLGVDGQQTLERLARMPWRQGGGLSIVASGLPAQLARWSESLVDLVELRIELYPWDELTTIDYLQHALVTAGRMAPVFTEDALYRLHTLSAGNPRHLARLADFALVAGAALGLEIVESEVVEGAGKQAGWKSGVTA